MHSIAMKRFLRKKFKETPTEINSEISISSNDWINYHGETSVKGKKFEVQMTKTIDGFLDGYGKYDSNSVLFKNKLSKYFSSLESYLIT